MPGMHDGFGPGHFGPDHFGGWPFWGPLFIGATLLWLLAPLAIAAAWLWWRRRRARPLIAADPNDPNDPIDPSAFEALRRRYVAGEIDARAFEEMTERLLVSEQLEQTERRQAPLLARYDA